MDLPSPEPLFLATLFHDIGKNGKDHALRGVQITRRILKRFKYPKEWTEEILFQIENHLLLVEIATRRDLNDEKVIVQCARHIGDINRLKMLYLLTWADAKATGPRAWSEWTADLVQELLFKILHILEEGELATPDSSQKVEHAKKKIQKETADRLSPEKLDSLFEVMPPRYLLNTDPMEVVRHIEMVDRLKQELTQNPNSAFVIHTREDEQKAFWEVCFVAIDRPGLFSDIAGVMALNNIDILSSHIYTWRDGTAVDIFMVTEPLDPIHTDEVWGKVETDFKSTFNGKLSLLYRLSQKTAPSIISGKKKPVQPPEVVVDNQSSDFFTLVEVFASNRIGLLYLITRTLFDLRLDIRVAKTGVKGDRIADIFYVRDLEGQKVEDQEQVNEIMQALIYQLANGS
jgi:[protein-PII] uridylyltransferase